MTPSDIHTAIRQVQNLSDTMDSNVDVMAGMCANRLRSADVSVNTLRKLKRELQQFDAVRGKWKS